MNDNALTVVEQKFISFYGDELIAVRVADGTIYVPIRPICNLLGLNWAGQRQRINRDPVLVEEATPVCVTHTGHEHGQSQEVDMISLPLKFLSGFLFGVSVKRVKLELQERLIKYQRECYEVLHEAFREGRLTGESGIDELLATDSPAAQAYKMASAIMKIARQQLLLESQIESNTNRIDKHAQRLELIEEQLGSPDRHVTPEQAMQISQAVKAIAHELSKLSGRNAYGGVYGELYRRFSVNSYKMLPASKFLEAMSWLNSWLQELQGDNVTF